MDAWMCEDRRCLRARQRCRDDALMAGFSPQEWSVSSADGGPEICVDAGVEF